MKPAAARKMLVEILADKTKLMDSPSVSPKLRDPDADVAMRALELDSLDQIEISMEVESRTGLHFDLAEMGHARTINELAAHVSRRTGG